MSLIKATSLVVLSKAVATAGTSVQATTNTALRPHAVYFEAATTNTGKIYIGDINVSSTNYAACLSAENGWSLGASDAHVSQAGHQLQLSDIYIDSSVSGEKVMISYLPHVV